MTISRYHRDIMAYSNSKQVTVRISKMLDEQIERLVPTEMRGGRKVEIRVAYVLREYAEQRTRMDVTNEG